MIARFALASIAAVAIAAHADEGETHPLKVTLGHYRYSDGADGHDVNARYSSDLGNLWAGYFRSADAAISQWRGGWDRTFGDEIRVLPSAQFASGGFVGGSLQLETGDPWFVGAGLGRTNLRPYVNLNFDPNDAWMLYGGHRSGTGQVISALIVHDNRENPDQAHYHLTWRQPLAEGHRLTLDALYKVGTVEGERIHRWGATATYDWPRFFVRVARDPNTNFTPVDSWRVSVGARF